MSRDLMNEDYYVSGGGQVPVKWTAPEVQHFVYVVSRASARECICSHSQFMTIEICDICRYVCSGTPHKGHP